MKIEMIERDEPVLVFAENRAEIVNAHDLLLDTARACRQIDGKMFPRYSFHETKTPCACPSPRVRIASRMH